MNDVTKGALFVALICCIWPLIVAIIGIIIDRRYREGGWKAVISLITRSKDHASNV